MPPKRNEHHRDESEYFHNLVGRKRAHDSRDRHARLARNEPDAYHVTRIGEQHTVRSGAKDSESNDTPEPHLGSLAKEKPPADTLEQCRRESDHARSDQKRKRRMRDAVNGDNPVDPSDRQRNDRDDHDERDRGTKGSPHQSFGRAASLTLTVTRLALGPIALLLASQRADGRLLAAAVIIASLSDVYDGKIARRFGVDTPGLRRFDSISDTVFYIFVAAAIWILHPDIIRSHGLLLCVFIAMQIGGHLFDLKKFGRDTSYHTWTGRAFGLSLFVAATLIFWTGSAVPWLAIALITGIISHIDALIITLTLPEWHHDVHTIANARRIRDEFTRRQRPSTAPP
jgi:CDP-diacylglycerol--glycerol-3-phosphate 3-phosphatidyltransferase